MELRNLHGLTIVVATMVVIDAVANPLILLAGAIAPMGFTTYISPIANGVDIGVLTFKIATMIVFAAWIYRAGRNLVIAGFDDLEFSVASRIWWFFVPIASLFRPYQGMRELWNVSHGNYPHDLNNSLVSTWWALWLLNNLGAWFIGMTQEGTTGIWIGAAIDIALACAAIPMIFAISRAQRGLGGSRLEEVFA